MNLKLLILTSLLTTTAFADIMPSSYNLRATYNYSKISGFVQIPKGGQNGSTTIERPTFDEMGIKKISSPEIKFQGNWDKFSAYTSFVYTKFNGASTLKEELITHAKLIPQNSTFKTKHKYQNYTVGVEYNLFSNEYLELKPLVEYSLYNFKYTYNATTPNNKEISSGRSFHWGQLNIGVEALTPITENYSIETTLKYNITQKKVREYLSLNLANKYTVYTNNNQKIDFLLGIGMSKLEFRDRQKERQNHIVHKIKPNIFAGIEFSF